MFYKKLIISYLLYNFINFITLQTLSYSRSSRLAGQEWNALPDCYRDIFGWYAK
jgi:hypothetical protein